MAMGERRTPAVERARDVLAAEAFAVPAADPELHHRPVRLPDVPGGGSEPQDVLAAEEFPVPAAPRSAAGRAPARGARWQRRLGMAGVLVAIVLGAIALRLLRRH